MLIWVHSKSVLMKKIAAADAVRAGRGEAVVLACCNVTFFEINSVKPRLLFLFTLMH